MSTTSITLPRKHAEDWLARYDGPSDGSDYDAVVSSRTARTITLTLGDTALGDLVSDSVHYAYEMGPEATGDIDYRPPARACLRGLARAGLQWDQRGLLINSTQNANPEKKD